jgi:peptidoglycan/xylan/chitin deacetylase (PgdA/CDA1 family)
MQGTDRMPAQSAREQVLFKGGGPSVGGPAKGEAADWPPRSVPILTFHSIDDESSPISFSRDRLRQGLERLLESGFQTIGLLQAVQAVAGRALAPERSCVITFDDGYHSVYDVAFPLLQRYGLTATVFLTVGEGATRSAQTRLPPLNNRAMLSWAEVNEMRRYGIEFGAHTLTHPDLRTIPLDRARREIEGSKQVIEDVLGIPVPSFAYPFGRSTPQVRALAEALFTCACTDQLGIAGPQSDPYQIARVDAYYVRATSWFGHLDTPLFQWYLRARNLPRSARRALRAGASG